MDCEPLSYAPCLLGDAESLHGYGDHLLLLSRAIESQRLELSGQRLDHQWSGVAAQLCRDRAVPIVNAFASIAARFEGVGSGVKVFADELGDCQNRARSIVQDARTLEGRIRWLEERVAEEAHISCGPSSATGPTILTPPSQYRWPLEQAESDKRELRRQLDQEIDRADAAALRCTGIVREHSRDDLKNGDWLDGVGRFFSHDVHDVIVDHAAVMKDVSHMLGTASSVLGMVPFIPGAAEAALALAAVAFVTDALLYACGEATKQDLLVDAATLALSVSGSGLEALELRAANAATSAATETGLLVAVGVSSTAKDLIPLAKGASFVSDAKTILDDVKPGAFAASPPSKSQKEKSGRQVFNNIEATSLETAAAG